jgi:hypothetical protein
MSILDFPRLHFQGCARVHAPTGQKHGFVDLGSNAVYLNGDRVHHQHPASDYHDFLERLGPRFNAAGEIDETGAFSMAMGWDFGGNGHFTIDATIISAQRQPFEVDQSDPVVGRSVDLWGHYNDYLGTTVNRARIFDCDPTSNWTTTILIGQLSFGRQERSHDVPNLLSAPVEGMQPARWQCFDHLRDLPDHCLNDEFQRSAVHQFTVAKTDEWLWSDEVATSPTVSMLREAMQRDDVLGLVVQFALSNMSAPTQPNFPVFWELHGTIGLWCAGEMKTYPHGRLLVPARRSQSNVPAEVLSNAVAQREPQPMSNLTVQITPQAVNLNLVTAVPGVGRAAKPGVGSIHSIAAKLDLGDLELRTVQSQRLIAHIPREAYQKAAHQQTSGLVDVPLAEPFEQLREEIEHQGLCIIGTLPNRQRCVLVQEKEVNLQIDEACLFLEFPDRKRNQDFAVEVEVRSFVRGRPAPVDAVYLRQFYHPKGLPHLRYDFEHSHPDQAFHFPPSHALDIVSFKPGREAEAGKFDSKCVISTDQQGQGWITLRGARSGATRVLLSDHPNDLPCDPNQPDEAIIAYDNDDRLGFWAGAGSFAVRVLTDDWHLEDIADEDVNFNIIYEHILAYYELCFSFMKAEVFSLADKCKVETYARLMWQMSDPTNRSKTYYMPPTRDMSQPKAMLLRKFLQNQQRIGYVPAAAPQPKSLQRSLQTRNQLVAALHHAAELEIAVMLQYIYAAYSIPNYATGAELVRRGRWTPEQLHLACGDNQEVRNHGMRGVLLEVSHEEMIHFLMVNNILRAIGEPFYAAVPNFNDINRRFSIEVDFALEPFNVGTLQRFIRFEFPDFLEEDLPHEMELTALTPSDLDDEPDSPSYGSLSELYRQIREGLQTIPDLFMVEKGKVGGEHHLFLRENIHKAHPDYQLEVDDLKSALFAIDVIVEQGEGCETESSKFEKSHYQQFRRMAEAFAQQHVSPTSIDRPIPWNPAYPALRNPTLHHRDHNTTVVTVPQTRTVMQIHDECYFLMMQLMVQHFGYTPTASLRRSKLMNAAIDVMAGMMRPLGELLMTLPSGKRGRTAGPAFEIESPMYISEPSMACQTIAGRFEQLGQQARVCEVIPDTVCELFDFYTKFFADLAEKPAF